MHPGAPPPQLVPTGWFDEPSAFEDGRCLHRVLSTTPEEGRDDIYIRDPLWVLTNTRYQARLLDAEGRLVPTSILWDDLRYQVVPDAPLEPDSLYTLALQDCERNLHVTFQTSVFGLPLVPGPSLLLDRTYALDFRNASWIEPGGVGPLLSLYFDAPVLLAVRAADPSLLQLAMSIGYLSGDGPLQDPSEPVLPFPPTSFIAHPFFTAAVDSIPLQISGATLPVRPFNFSGTFSPDGERIGGGTLSGRIDTRYAGVLLSDPRPEAVCEFGAGLGVLCTSCTDGEPYCLDIEVREIDGQHLPSLLLREY